METDFWKPYQAFDHRHNVFEHCKNLGKFVFTTSKAVVKI